MRVFYAFLLCLIAATSTAEPRPFNEVDISALTRETQVARSNESGIDLAWWIPAEFFEVSLRQNAGLTNDQITELMDTLRPYTLVAVVQADVSDFGEFDFLNQNSVQSGLVVSYVTSDGKTIDLPLNEVSDPALDELIAQLKPVLSSAMGNLGQNFYFFPMHNKGQRGRQIVSPYEKGAIQIEVTPRDSEDSAPIVIPLPLNSLVVPRICPNGKPAHVSWQYCPWSGAKLD